MVLSNMSNKNTQTFPEINQEKCIKVRNKKNTKNEAAGGDL